MKERPSTGISASLLAIFRFSRDDWLLPADWIRSGIGSWSGKRVFHDFASVVLGTFCRLHCSRVLATAPRQAMRGEGTVAGQPVALGRSTRGDRNGPVPPAARWIYRG